MDSTLLLFTGVLLLIYAAFRIRKQLRFFADRNIPYEPAKFSLTVDSSTHSAVFLQQCYERFKGQHSLAGLYLFVKPIIMPMDLELIKHILAKDFNHFQNRGMYHNEKDDPLSGHLFALEGERWRNLRAKITPIFTSGKMKMMYPTMLGAGKQFSEYMDEQIGEEAELEMKDLLARFTTDMIGTCAFGIECNSMREPNSLFRTMGRQFFDAPRSALKDLLKMLCPEWCRRFGMREVAPDVSEFFLNVVRDTIDYREKNGVHRNDFMDLLIGLMKAENLGMESVSFNEVAAQAYVFFIAGYETSSTTMAWALYELSINPDIQEKGRQCVQHVLDKHNGLMSYEAIIEMHYIDQILQETLRKYPPVPHHFRLVNKDYRVPNTDAILPAGSFLIVPIYAIQRDPDIYPEPDKFDPERFSPEEISKRHPYAWTPFGEGPRTCIGMRFGMMQAQIGLALLLKSFAFSTGSKSTVPLSYRARSIVLTPAEDLWLKVEKVKG